MRRSAYLHAASDVMGKHPSERALTRRNRSDRCWPAKNGNKSWILLAWSHHSGDGSLLIALLQGIVP